MKSLPTDLQTLFDAESSVQLRAALDAVRLERRDAQEGEDLEIEVDPRAVQPRLSESDARALAGRPYRAPSRGFPVLYWFERGQGPDSDLWQVWEISKFGEALRGDFTTAAEAHAYAARLRAAAVRSGRGATAQELGLKIEPI